MNMELFKLGFNEVTCLRERNLTPPGKAGVEFDRLVLFIVKWCTIPRWAPPWKVQMWPQGSKLQFSLQEGSGLCNCEVALFNEANWKQYK